MAVTDLIYIGPKIKLIFTTEIIIIKNKFLSSRNFYNKTSSNIKRTKIICLLYYPEPYK